MSAINPFQIPAALAERCVGRRLRASAEPPPWMGAALLASFAWFFLAYHTPGSPRALAVYLTAYAVVVVVAALMWGRSEEHTSELQSLMRISYAVFCLKKKIKEQVTNAIVTRII